MGAGGVRAVAGDAVRCGCSRLVSWAGALSRWRLLGHSCPYVGRPHGSAMLPLPVSKSMMITKIAFCDARWTGTALGNHIGNDEAILESDLLSAYAFHILRLLCARVPSNP
mgnify:CR=1 FL=1